MSSALQSNSLLIPKPMNMFTIHGKGEFEDGH